MAKGTVVYDAKTGEEVLHHSPAVLEEQIEQGMYFHTRKEYLRSRDVGRGRGKGLYTPPPVKEMDKSVEDLEIKEPEPFADLEVEEPVGSAHTVVPPDLPLADFTTVKGIGQETNRLLNKASIHTWDDVLNLTPAQIAQLVENMPLARARALYRQAQKGTGQISK